jgi:hypothetical protein
MALESFYGGKQGVSPVIKARFKYVDTDDLAYIARSGQTTILTKEEAAILKAAGVTKNPDNSNNPEFYQQNQSIT